MYPKNVTLDSCTTSLTLFSCFVYIIETACNLKAEKRYWRLGSPPHSRITQYIKGILMIPMTIWTHEL